MYKKPFLKWVGGKHRALATILRFVNKGRRLIIPFAGSLAIFLNTDFQHYLISDTNPDLITTYKILADNGDEFIHYTQTLFTEPNNTAEMYYKLREEFNSTNDPFRKSALFVYLNRHCFNGLCRYNSKGEFNTPFGLYTKPYFPEKEMREFCNKVKQSVSVHFSVCDYTTALDVAVAGDVVYCDPPAIARSSTARFANYHAVRYSTQDHEELAAKAEELSRQGISVLITNHDVESTRHLYKSAHIETFKLNTLVSARSESRIPVNELIAFFDSGMSDYNFA